MYNSVFQNMFVNPKVNPLTMKQSFPAFLLTPPFSNHLFASCLYKLACSECFI